MFNFSALTIFTFVAVRDLIEFCHLFDADNSRRVIRHISWHSKNCAENKMWKKNEEELRGKENNYMSKNLHSVSCQLSTEIHIKMVEPEATRNVC